MQGLLELTQCGATMPGDFEVSPPGFLLSLNQERGLLSQEVARRMGREPAPNLILVCQEISGHLVVSALEKALQRIVKPHGALRTTVCRNPLAAREDWDRALSSFARDGIVRRGLYVQDVRTDGPVQLQWFGYSGCSSATLVRTTVGALLLQVANSSRVQIQQPDVLIQYRNWRSPATPETHR